MIKKSFLFVFMHINGNIYVFVGSSVSTRSTWSVHVWCVVTSPAWSVNRNGYVASTKTWWSVWETGFNSGSKNVSFSYGINVGIAVHSIETLPSSAKWCSEVRNFFFFFRLSLSDRHFQGTFRRNKQNGEECVYMCLWCIAPSWEGGPISSSLGQRREILFWVQKWENSNTDNFNLF